MKKAEFGSVKFFRRAITMITMIIIAALLVALIFTSNKLGKVKDDLDYYQNDSTLGAVLAQDTAVEGGEPFPYQSLYPDMYVDKAEEYTKLYDAERFCYLTFVGGPSEQTEKILDILEGKGIQATFFTFGGDNDSGHAIMKRIVDEGHSIGIYGYALPQKELYVSIETYMEDFWSEFHVLYGATGVKPEIFRFAGGTTNKFNSTFREALSAEMVRRGFCYYDWNATGGDNISGATKESIIDNAIATGGEKQRIFMLLHDTRANSATVEALPYIIEHFQNEGYEFRAITNDIQPMAFE